MKKTFFLLFSAGILFSINGKAQSVAPSPSFGGGIIVPDLGGEWGVMILVTDEKGNPVVGAKATLPCSGQTYQLTDAKGIADFTGSGICPCSQGVVYVTTVQSSVNQGVTCGTNDVTLPQ